CSRRARRKTRRSACSSTSCRGISSANNGRTTDTIRSASPAHCGGKRSTSDSAFTASGRRITSMNDTGGNRLSRHPLRFGMFMGPFHATNLDPTYAIERDLQLVTLLDRLGYDEAWIGEHHSGGFEIIASPEVFIAAAAERTKHIRLGTGVKSLPFHHPFIVAETMAQLDHMTRGRVMFG